MDILCFVYPFICWRGTTSGMFLPLQRWSFGWTHDLGCCILDTEILRTKAGKSLSGCHESDTNIHIPAQQPWCYNTWHPMWRGGESGVLPGLDLQPPVHSCFILEALSSWHFSHSFCHGYQWSQSCTHSCGCPAEFSPLLLAPETPHTLCAAPVSLAAGSFQSWSPKFPPPLLFLFSLALSIT